MDVVARHPRLSAWISLAVSVAIYAGVSAILHQPFHEGGRALRYFDLRIYRGAAERVVHGGSLYSAPIHDGMGFTYPPFAALCLTPLASGSITVDAVVVTALNIALLVWLLHRTLRLARGSSRDPARAVPGRPRTWTLAAGLAAAALWLEPISVTLGYGQIDLLIAALVVGDLSRPDDARGKGAGVGLAAGLKLTPLIFIPYLLLSGRRRAGAWAVAVFTASVAVAYAVAPGDAARFWGGRLYLRSSRVGDAADTANQSLRGVFARLDPTAHPSLAAYVAIAAFACLGLSLAVRASRHGDEAAGFSFTALSALLVSPISWTHHWTLAVLALLVLARHAHEQRARALRRATAALVCVAYAYLPEWLGPTHPRGALSLLTGDPYVLAAAGVMVASATSAIRSGAHLARRRGEWRRVDRHASVRGLERLQCLGWRRGVASHTRRLWAATAHDGRQPQ